MPETAKQHLITVFRKCSRMLLYNVTAQEYINHAFDQFSYIDRVCSEVIPTLWGLIPDVIRGEFTAAVRGATLPGFRWHPFYIGGSRPMTEDDLRRDEDLRTTRVQAWAVEFVRFLADVSE